MSEDATLLTPELLRYVQQHTAGDDPFLAEVKEAARAEGFPPIWIAPAQASLLRILLRAARARIVVEVGTLAAVSAIVMARALPPDGRVHTIEVDPVRAEFAERWIARSDVGTRIVVHRGAGTLVLPRFPRFSADAIFIDADKPGYPRYLREGLRIVRPGGLLLADNALAFGEILDPGTARPEVAAMRAFNELVAAMPGLHGVIVPLGDGLWVAVKD
jgi:predicted O-methyltransferase YrrM